MPNDMPKPLYFPPFYICEERHLGTYEFVRLLPIGDLKHSPIALHLERCQVLLMSPVECPGFTAVAAVMRDRTYVVLRLFLVRIELA